MHRLSLLVLYYAPHFATFWGREFPLYQKFPCDSYVSVPSSAVAEMLPLVTLCPYTAPCPCWLCVQGEGHIPAALSLQKPAHGCRGSQTAFPHCHNHMCSFWSHRQRKRGQWPQLFLKLPLKHIIWGWEGPSRFGTGFLKELQKFARNDSNIIQWGESAEKK